MSSVAPPAELVAAGFHDAECGGYAADLGLWLALADTVGGPVLDLGAGTGRVSLPLAAAGHEVFAVDLDPALLSEAARRAADQGIPLATYPADLRTLDADLPASAHGAKLVLVPMQTIQLLGGPAERTAAFAAAAAVAAPEAELAISVVPEVETFDGRDAFPALLPPDEAQLGGFTFLSTPRAVLQEGHGPIDMHRRRVVRGPDGAIVGNTEDVVITLDPVSVRALTEEAAAGGWTRQEVVETPPTDEHAASTILVFARAEAAR